MSCCTCYSNYEKFCYQSHHPCHHLTTLPAPARNVKGMLMKYNSEVVPLSDEGITDVDIYCDCLRTVYSQAVVEVKANFVPNSPWSFTTRYFTSWKSAASVSPYHSRPVAFWSLSAFEQLQGPHHQQHIRCFSGVRSGTTLRRTFCSTVKAIRCNLQCKTCGTTRLQLQTSSTWTTDDKREKSCWAITTTTEQLRLQMMPKSRVDRNASQLRRW